VDKLGKIKLHFFVSQEAVRQFKKDWLTALLVRHGTVAATAHAAGMNRTDLHKVMLKLGIQTPKPRHYGNWGDL
jgi:DNA-binding NtrC family response regulator